MHFTIKEEKEFQYIEEGEGDVLLLLHGLFGGLSNWNEVLKHFSTNYKVVIPILPIHMLPIRQTSLQGLVKFIEAFIKLKKFERLTLVGNSLGGHLALMHTLKNPNLVKRLVLTGSSGLFENAMGGSFPKRGDYEYIKDRIAYTFFDPKTAAKVDVDEIFSITNDIQKAIRIIAIAKSAQRNNMAQEIVRIKTRTLLIWGLNDTITPPMVAHDFNRLIPNSTLRFIDKCCHTPMMEHPEKFNELLEQFLTKNVAA